MYKFSRVAKLGHKYTELANKNKIFSAVSGNADKNYSDRGRFRKGNRGCFTKGASLILPISSLTHAEVQQRSKRGHKYTELANKNKIFLTVSGDADKNYVMKSLYTRLWYIFE